MPQFLLRQPNGLYARFSTIVDDFCEYDMTEAEALDWAQGYCGKAEGAEKFARARRDEDRSNTSILGDGLLRWQECLRILENAHGKEVMEERKRELSKPVMPADSPPAP